MKRYKSKTWQFETAGTDGNVTLFGVNIFDYEWKNTGQRIEVTDSAYGQKHLFSIFKVLIEDKEYEFACGEFSNCVYGFYVQKY